MPCPTNCVFDGSSDAGICCMLCAKFFHGKCTGLSARTIDQLENNSHSLVWFCKECRKPGSELVASYRVATAAFKDLSLELSSLQSKFSKLSAEFREPKLLVEVEDRIKSIKAKNQKKRKHADTVDNEGSIPFPKTLTSSSSNNEIVNPIITITDGESATLVDDPPLKKLQTYSMVIRSQLSSSPAPETSKHTSLPTTLSIPQENRSSDMPTLKVVAPIKSIFVASENDILEYMSAKNAVLDKASITVRKFKFKYDRKSSSFRIFVPLTVLKTVLNTSFWPKGVIVHEFKNNPKPKVIAPAAKLVDPKN